MRTTKKQPLYNPPVIEYINSYITNFSVQSTIKFSFKSEDQMHWFIDKVKAMCNEGE